ncbi:hypothetical protein DFH09DRAFT_850282, partial [Mycena vulgaris]
EEFETVAKPPSPLRGCDHTISLAAPTAAKEVYSKDPSVMLNELIWHLPIHHDVAISCSALYATLVCARFTRKVLQKIASKCDTTARVEFEVCIQGTRMEFVAVDESSKDQHEIARNYGHSPVGERA